MIRRATAVATLSLVLGAPACGRGMRVTLFELDGHPSAVTVVGDQVWVSDDVNHSLHVLSASSGAETRPPIRVSRNPVALAAGGGHVWVAHAEGHLTAVDVRTRTVRKRRVGGSLTGVAYALGRVWLTDLERDQLVDVDPETLRTNDRIRVPNGAVRVAAGVGRSLWVTNRENTVTQVVDGRVRYVREVGGGPIGLASDGGTVWVANSDEDSVTPLRGEDGTPSDPVAVGRGPVAVAAVDGDAWAANQDDGTLTSLRRPDVPALELGTHPRGVVAVEWFGRKEVWVAGSNPDAVVRVQL